MPAVNRFCFLSAADNAVTPRGPRELSESENFVLYIDTIPAPRFAQLRIIERSENSYRKNTAIWTSGVYCRLHHHEPTGRVHRRKANTHRCNVPHRPGDGVWNVVKLEIEKHIASGIAKPLHDVRTRRGEELAANLVEPAPVIQRLNQRHRARGIRKIQGDDRNGCHDCHSRVPTISLTD